MAESIGMQIVNKRTEDIIQVMAERDFTLVDLRRIQIRFASMAELAEEVIAGVQKESGGERGSQKCGDKEDV